MTTPNKSEEPAESVLISSPRALSAPTVRGHASTPCCGQIVAVGNRNKGYGGAQEVACDGCGRAYRLIAQVSGEASSIVTQTYEWWYLNNDVLESEG